MHVCCVFVCAHVLYRTDKCRVKDTEAGLHNGNRERKIHQ